MRVTIVLRVCMSASSKQVELANTTSPSAQSQSRNEPCAHERVRNPI